MLRVPDIGHAVRTIQEQHIASGQQLMARLQVIIDKMLLGSRQVVCVSKTIRHLYDYGTCYPALSTRRNSKRIAKEWVHSGHRRRGFCNLVSSIFNLFSYKQDILDNMELRTIIHY